jgi:uncharacterized Zn-binding protein involved in type VI secretion
MPGVQRQGDSNVRGGVISSGDASVRVNGVPVAVQGSPITPYNIGKNRINAVTTGSSSVRANGRPLTLSTSPDSAGTPMTGSGTNVTAT